MKNRTYYKTLHLVNCINRYKEDQQNEIINQCGELMNDYFTPVNPDNYKRDSY